MGLDIRVVPFGREASRALRDEIAVAQGGDPLAPVTVVVPRGITGLGVRRLLASGDLGPAPSTVRLGAANLRFTTLPRLAADLAGSSRADDGALPATETVVRAVARMTLGAAGANSLGPARDHPGTARSLVKLYRDLTGVSAATRRRLIARGGRAAEVVSLVEAMDDRLRLGWIDDGRRTDLAIQAISAMDGVGPGAPAAELVVVYLPTHLSVHDRRLVAALAAVRRLVVIIGVTGDPFADSTTREMAARVGGDGQPPADPTLGDGVPVLTGTTVISAPTADTEVRVVTRELMARRRAGTRFERMAIVHGGSGPYERVVRETLAAAGIPSNGVSTRRLETTFAGRTLLGAFELYERGWRRAEVMAWVTEGPRRGGHGRPVEAGAWDLISREAGVTKGLQVWRRHLGAYIEERALRLDELDGPGGVEAPPATVPRLRAELRQAAELRSFVDDLAQRFEVAPSSWSGWVDWADALLDRYIGRPAARDEEWSTDEEEALTAVRSALAGLRILDRLDEAPDRSTFRSALISELEEAAPQTSRFGTGVLVGPISLLTGLDFDTVFILGMVDGRFPVRGGDDALLPDDERAAAGEDIPLRGGRRHEAYRDYLAGLATAPERVLSFARGDQRRGGEFRPSRWLLDTLGGLEGAGRRLYSRDVSELDPMDGFLVVPSFTDAVLNGAEPMSEADRDLRSLLRWSEAGRDLAAHFLADMDATLGTGLEVHRSRRSNRFTRFDGRIAEVDIPSPTSVAAVSATSLETYAACPRRYLMQQVLRIEERETPEEVITIDPAHRGLMMHEILERFIGGQLSLPRQRRIRPTQPWSPDDHARMAEIAKQVFQTFEDRGLVGRQLLWDLARATIERELHRFLKLDDRYRAEGGWVPERVELEFGPGHGRPVELRLPDGRTVNFKGYVDRMDMASDGSLSVTDYKTGSAQDLDGLADDPVLNGRKLQLPIYGLAARSRIGNGPVRVAYWFVSEKGRFTPVSYQLDQPVLDRFGEVVSVLVDGIDAGMFPARPGKDDSNCTYCGFQAMCPGNRQDSWARVRHHAGLEDYVALAEGTGEAR
ncbi:MAG TPA: PD-(D/E)XK nuclease family protein [Acidimicrobiales bacterium]|nr:PD-(D/E)XK nuclease family protein [Acidimicrobiales bacterium]